MIENTIEKEEATYIAQTILSQISMQTKWACGFRDPAFHTRDGKVTVIFRVTIKKGTKHWINISLEPSDTYKVTLVAVRGLKQKIDEEHDNVYCEELSEVVYHMCNK